MTSFMTLSHQWKYLNIVPLEAPYPDVYTDTFIFFLRPLCKFIWMNVHYFPNAPRMYAFRCVFGSVEENLKTCYFVNGDISPLSVYIKHRNIKISQYQMTKAQFIDFFISGNTE